MKDISYVTGNEERLDELKELWEGLNRMHAEKSPYFQKHFRESLFETRRDALMAKAKAKEGSLFIVIAQNEAGKNVGYCIASILGAEGEIESIFIHPKYRKQGIGDRLMRQALAWIDGHHPKKVLVSVGVGNEEVFGFYEKFGFYPRLTVLQTRPDET